MGDFEANSDIGGKVGNFIKGIMTNPPAKPNKTLLHACLEGPEWGVIYRGNGKLVNGTPNVYLPYYYESFNETAFKVYGSVQTGKFDWEVKATRDDIDPLEVEPDKEEQ